MKQKNKGPLLVWLPTEYREEDIIVATWGIVSSPIFSFGIAVVAVNVMIYFDLTGFWWMWAIAPSAVSMGIVTIVYRYMLRGKLLISKSQAKKHNIFYPTMLWLPNRYLNRIDTESERKLDDHAASRLLYRHLGEALITLGLHEETGLRKIKALTGYEFQQIMPVEYYTDFILASGIGYVLLMPSVSLIAKIESVDERIISRVLRDSGIIGWTVERVSFDDDLVLFVLRDETVSRAYDFSRVR